MLPVKDFLAHEREGKVQIVVESMEEFSKLPSSYNYVTLVSTTEAVTYKYSSTTSHAAHDGVNIIADNKEYDSSTWTTPPTDTGTGCYVKVSADSLPIVSFNVGTETELHDALTAARSNSERSKYIINLTADISLADDTTVEIGGTHDYEITGAKLLNVQTLKVRDANYNKIGNVVINVATLGLENTVDAYKVDSLSFNGVVRVGVNFTRFDSVDVRNLYVGILLGPDGTDSLSDADSIMKDANGNSYVGYLYVNISDSVSFGSGGFETVEMLSVKKAMGNILGVVKSSYNGCDYIDPYLHQVQLVALKNQHVGYTGGKSVDIVKGSHFVFRYPWAMEKDMFDAMFLNTDFQVFYDSTFKAALKVLDRDTDYKVHGISSRYNSLAVFQLKDTSYSEYYPGNDLGEKLEVTGAFASYNSYVYLQNCNGDDTNNADDALYVPNWAEGDISKIFKTTSGTMYVDYSLILT